MICDYVKAHICLEVVATTACPEHSACLLKSLQGPQFCKVLTSDSARWSVRVDLPSDGHTADRHFQLTKRHGDDSDWATQLNTSTKNNFAFSFDDDVAAA
jgi:hypothetical protein